MPQYSNRLYEFGEFRLDTRERLLWRGEETLVLPPKVFDTLLLLLEKEGRVVSKSELMETVWAESFVEESNLSQNIYTLRRTLGVDHQGAQFIETVPRRGYRFAVPVKISMPSVNDAISDLTLQPGEAPAYQIAADEKPAPSEGDSPAPAVDSELGAEQPSELIGDAGIAFEEQLPTPRPSRYLMLGGLGVLILLVLGLAIFQSFNRRGNQTVTKSAPIEQLRFQRLTDSGDVAFVTLSPNGELLALVRQEDQGESVWVKQIATGSSVQTLPPSRKGYRSLVFSPDGSYLFFREEADPGSIYRTSVFGSAQKKIADRVWSDFAISPDGQQVAFIRRDSAPNTAYLLMVAGIDGGEEREVNSRQAPFSYRHALAYSPDGAKLLVSAGSLKDPLSKLLTVDVATGAETELKTPRWRAITRALWHPKGNYLVVSARDMNEATSQLWLLDYPEGEIRRLTNDLESYFWISLSIDGRMLVTRQQRIVTHLWLLPNGDVKKARQLTFGGRSLDGYVGLAWAPDGKIIFSGFADNLTDLYSLDSDGSNRVPLTANAGLDNNYPVISADGRFIVFTSNRTGVRQIWRMGVDGRNQKQLTFDGEHKDTAQYPAISPDGTEVFFIKYGTGPASIWKVSIDGGPSVPVSRLTNATAEGFLSISPDGKWLAYRHVSAQPEIGGEEPMMRVGVLPIDGNGEPKLFDLPMRRPIMHWTADSSAFDYAAGNFNASSLVRQPLVGDPQPLVALPDRLFNFAWSADRKNLVVSRGRQQGDAILITNLP